MVRLWLRHDRGLVGPLIAKFQVLYGAAVICPSRIAKESFGCWPEGSQNPDGLPDLCGPADPVEIRSQIQGTARVTKACRAGVQEQMMAR